MEVPSLGAWTGIRGRRDRERVPTSEGGVAGVQLIQYYVNPTHPKNHCDRGAAMVKGIEPFLLTHDVLRNNCFTNFQDTAAGKDGHTQYRDIWW
jgi:hypothetical protein